jgi:hypothetical protein
MTKYLLILPVWTEHLSIPHTTFGPKEVRSDRFIVPTVWYFFSIFILSHMFCHIYNDQLFN